MFPLSNRRTVNRNEHRAGRGSLMHPNHRSFVLSFPQIELSRMNRFDFHWWHAVVADPEREEDESWNLYRNIGPIEGVYREFIDDLALKDFWWRDMKTQVRLREAISSIVAENDVYQPLNNQMFVNIIMKHFDRPFTNEEMKELFQALPEDFWPLFYGMRIPRPLWEYIQTLLRNIRNDFEHAIDRSDDSDDMKMEQKQELVHFANSIAFHRNTMLWLFANERDDVAGTIEELHGWSCPFKCHQCYEWGYRHEFRIVSFPNRHTSRLNMIQHLEWKLTESYQYRAKYNFHFMLVVFIANLPNDHGADIRNNRNLMALIEEYVPDEQMFIEMNNVRTQIRNTKNAAAQALRDQMENQSDI